MSQPSRIYDTDHWWRLKQEVWRRCKGKCERCRIPLRKGACHLHHLTYRNAGRERLEEVQYICLACHEHYHPHRTFLPVWMEEARARRNARRRLTVKKPTMQETARNAIRKAELRRERTYGGRRP